MFSLLLIMIQNNTCGPQIQEALLKYIYNTAQFLLLQKENTKILQRTYFDFRKKTFCERYLRCHFKMTSPLSFKNNFKKFSLF